MANYSEKRMKLPLSLITCFVAVLVLFALMSRLPAWADQPMPAIRITCIPEMRYFEFEYKQLSSEATEWVLSGYEVQENPQTEKRIEKRIKKHLKVLKRYGLFDAQKLQYECKLPQSTYTLTGGDYYGDGITVSLTHNGGPFISDVLVGPNRFGKPSIDQVSIFEGMDALTNRNVTICFGGNAPGVLGNCKSNLGLVHISQEKIEEWVERRN